VTLRCRWPQAALTEIPDLLVNLTITTLPPPTVECSFSDVVEEAQEIVELSLKGMLRFVGIEPPKFHDVGVRRSGKTYMLYQLIQVCWNIEDETTRKREIRG